MFVQYQGKTYKVFSENLDGTKLDLQPVNYYYGYSNVPIGDCQILELLSSGLHKPIVKAF